MFQHSTSILPRFLAITRPLTYSVSPITKRTFMVTFISSIWIVNSIWNFGPLLIADCLCENDTLRVIHNTTVGIFWILPIVAIFFMYINIVNEIFLKQSITSPRSSGLQLRGGVTIFWIVLIFLITCLPNSIYSFLHFIDDSGELFGLTAEVQRSLSVTTNLFKVTNCFLNPLIYFIRLKPFRTTFVRFRLNSNVSVISANTQKQLYI